MRRYSENNGSSFCAFQVVCDIRTESVCTVTNAGGTVQLTTPLPVTRAGTSFRSILLDIITSLLQCKQGTDSIPASNIFLPVTEAHSENSQSFPERSQTWSFHAVIK